MENDFLSNYPNYPQVNIERILADLPPSIPQQNLASEFHKRLSEYIIEFEEELNPEEEVGLRLVSFGESVTIHVDDIGFCDPSMICFYGSNTEGKPVQLIQHVSQISFLLTVVERTDKSRPRIGFKLKKQLEEEQDDDEK